MCRRVAKIWRLSTRSVVNLVRSQVYHTERPPYLFAARSPLPTSGTSRSRQSTALVICIKNTDSFAFLSVADRQPTIMSSGWVLTVGDLTRTDMMTRG